MYRYDEFDRRFLDERVAQYRGQVARRLSGQLTEDEFRPLRLMNGLYLQLHAYMLRVSIPYGTLNSDQLRMLAHVARTYDKGYGHFTTRQNIQYNWIKLEESPDILADLAKVEMHGIQTSGNSFRNITTDPFAGVTEDEIEDPRPWCEIIRQWSALHPEFSFLPRKFKIAVSAAAKHDRAAVKMHDLGLYLRRNEAGEAGFQVLIGGGLGRTPYLGLVLREFLPKRDLLAYLEAALRVYNQYGRRDNIFKARVKILVHALGIEKLREEVEAEFDASSKDGLELPEAAVDAIAKQFTPPPYADAAGDDAILQRILAADPLFARWVKNNTHAHKVAWPRHRLDLLEAAGPPAGRLQRRPDGIDRGFGRRIELWRNPRHPRTEPGAAACAQEPRCTGFGSGWSRPDWAAPISASPATSSPAPASIIAASPRRAPSRSPRFWASAWPRARKR